MTYGAKKPKEMTRKDFERAQERHWRRVEPYFNRLQAEWILKEMGRQLGVAKGQESANGDD